MESIEQLLAAVTAQLRPGSSTGPLPGESLSQIALVLAHVKRQQRTWDVCKTLAQQSNLDALLATAVEGLQEGFSLGADGVSVFMVSSQAEGHPQAHAAHECSQTAQ